MRSVLRRAFSVWNRKGDERAYFDPDYYRAAYPDVAGSGIDAFGHFMAHGWREGRNPSARFNTLYVRDAHMDGEASNPLSYFVSVGAADRGVPALPPSEQAFVAVQRALVAGVFDAAYYRLLSGGDVADPIDHYLTIGWRRGLAPNAHFDADRYVAENAFVAALSVAPLYHAQSQKRMMEARGQSSSQPSVARATIAAAIAPEFDRAFYLRDNPDVAKGKADPFDHYLDYGWREGRRPTPLFDTAWYLRTNRKVAEAKLEPFYHYLTSGRADGLRGNPVGARLYPPLAAPTDEQWRTAKPAADIASAEVVIVVPVYRGFEESLASIYAVLANREQATPFALHVVNDRTPDAMLGAALGRLAGQGLFSYAVNERNLGFVQSCNAALERFADKEVILLNADTRVHGNWVDRLLVHARSDPAVATVTALSNNATICSYPGLNINNLVEPECTAEVLDDLAAACNKGRASEIPTGVGFCFLMTRASRDRVGLFDAAAFGKGYGEENDYCLRAAKAGLRNVLAEDVFVYHAGEVSFADLVASEYGPGQQALLAKHPDYPLRIRQHLAADPSSSGRTRLDLYRIARLVRSRCVVFVTHSLSGGVATYAADEERRLAADGCAVVRLRVGAANRWSVEVVAGETWAPSCPNLRPMAFNQVRGLIAEFLDWLDPRSIDIQSLVGFDWVATEGLLDLVKASGIPYTFMLHDYSVVCHRNDLVLTNGRYCGLPDVSVCRTCVATDRSYPEALDPAVRRRTFDLFLSGAKAVFAPSQDMKDRLQRAGASYAIEVRPHRTVFGLDPVAKPSPGGEVVDIVTIGAVGPHKGSGIILNLARYAQATKLGLRFHIVGYSDLKEDMRAAGVEETGRYDDEAEARRLVEAIRPTLVFLPSIWPETFCYALSLAFEMRIAPVVFDIGAQAERVRQAGFGHVLPYGLNDDVQALADALLVCAKDLGTASPVEAPTR